MSWSELAVLGTVALNLICGIVNIAVMFYYRWRINKARDELMQRVGRLDFIIENIEPKKVEKPRHLV